MPHGPRSISLGPAFDRLAEHTAPFNACRPVATTPDPHGFSAPLSGTLYSTSLRRFIETLPRDAYEELAERSQTLPGVPTEQKLREPRAVPFFDSKAEENESLGGKPMNEGENPSVPET